MATKLRMKKVQAHYEFDKRYVTKEELLDVANYSVDYTHEVRFSIDQRLLSVSAYKSVQCDGR